MWNEIVDRISELGRNIASHVPLIAIGAVVILATWLAARLFSRVLARALGHSRMRRSHVDLLTKLIGAMIWIIGLLAAATILFPGITPGKLLTVLGVSSVAIGFAFKDVFENFLAGIVILLRNTFEIGEWVECEGYLGQVERISARDSLIRQADGQLVVLPNAMLFKNGLRIQTDRDERRLSLMCGVDYGTDLDEAQQVLQQAVQDCESVSTKQPVQVFAQAFGGSSIDFEIAWWCGSTPLEVRRSRDEVVRAIKRALDAAKIEIPFPHRTLTFKEQLHVASPRAEERTEPATA